MYLYIGKFFALYREIISDDDVYVVSAAIILTGYLLSPSPSLTELSFSLHNIHHSHHVGYWYRYKQDRGRTSNVI